VVKGNRKENHAKVQKKKNVVKKENRMIYLGADHAGFYLKEAVKKYLAQKSIAFRDLGNVVYDHQDDFPDFALRVAHKISGTKHRGLLFCGSATGMVIAANKISGIRAGAAHNEYTARQSKEHDDVNILVLPARLITTQTAKRLIVLWMKTKFSKKEKYRRRVRKIQKIEQGKM